MLAEVVVEPSLLTSFGIIFSAPVPNTNASGLLHKMTACAAHVILVPGACEGRVQPAGPVDPLDPLDPVRVLK